MYKKWHTRKNQVGCVLLTVYLCQASAVELTTELQIASEYRRYMAPNEEGQDDALELGLELRTEWHYRLTDSVSFFAEAKAFTEAIHTGDQWDAEGSIERGQIWVLWEELLGSHFGLQLGRQEFKESREWWWDEDLDAVRLDYRRDSWDLALGLAKESAPRSTLEETIDPAAKDVMRGIGQAAWRWHEQHQLEAFLLWQNDTSSVPSLNSVIEKEQEDESDADLFWVGLRATGEQPLSSYGTLSYWFDSALVWGDEISIDFESVDDDLSQVESLQRQNVRGWAIDVGGYWSLPLASRPFFILGYASGSGDADDEGLASNRTFRQTGLQNNEERFKYYGELLEPELSNLGIATLGVGFPLFEDSLLALVYHHYRQVDATPFLRNANLNRDPDGSSADIGQEWDLILKLEEWDKLDLEAIGAVFEAGRGFGQANGERSYKVFLELTYEF